MNILNLYAGIGGNRKLWTGYNITAVESNEKIANIYKHFFPNDTVIIGDAHDYLLEHFNEFDFIWSSPPCQTHSQFRFNINVRRGQSEPLYPDMRLYEEIIFLQHYFKGKWVVENVAPYYEPLIKPTIELERHLFWSNFKIAPTDFDRASINLIKRGQIKDLQQYHNISLEKFNIPNKRQILRNCVNPQVGLYILKQALK
jgi:DNA (cytosine-5)-methyltransferase 1